MAGKTKKDKYNEKFTEIYSALDLNALKAFLEGYAAEEKITGPAGKLLFYFNSIEETKKELDGAFDAFGMHENLDSAEKLVYDFLEKYGFELMDSPQVQSLVNYNSRYNMLALEYGVIRNDDFFKTGEKAVNELAKEEKNLIGALQKHYSDIYEDEFDPDNLEGELENTEKSIGDIRLQLEKDRKAIDDFKLLDAYIKNLSDEINNNPELNKNYKGINFFDKMMQRYNPETNRDIADAEKKVEDLDAKINEINLKILQCGETIEKNSADSARYRNAEIAITGMEDGCALTEKGLTSESLGKRHSILENAFGELSRLSMSIQGSGTSFKKAFKANIAGFKDVYSKAKNDIISNFSDDPTQTQIMKDMFANIEKDGSASALDLLVVQNQTAYYNNLVNIKRDIRDIKAYEDTSRILEETREKDELLEKAKAERDALKKELDETAETLKAAKTEREAQKADFFGKIKLSDEEKNRLKGLSNKEFYRYLCSKKQDYISKRDEILESGEMKKAKETLEKKITEKSTLNLSELEKKAAVHNIELNNAEKKKGKLEKHIDTFNSIADRAEKHIKKMDLMYSELADVRKEPDRYENLRNSLKNINDRLGRIKNSKPETKFYTAMYEKIEETLRAVATGHSGTIRSALGALEYETNEYIKAHKKDGGFFGTSLGKLRLSAANDLKSICENKELYKEVNVGTEKIIETAEKTPKEVCAGFKKNYKKFIADSNEYFGYLADTAVKNAEKERKLGNQLQK